MDYRLFVALIYFTLTINTVFTKKECYDPTEESAWKYYFEGSKCGQSKLPLERVMGGTNAALGEFPWMAQIGYKSSSQGLHIRCDGSVISKKHVLTAAHCCFGSLDAELKFVRLGEYDTRTEEDCLKGTCAPKHIDMKVQRFQPHEAYDSVTMENDICLITLEDEIEFNEYIQPICLPSSCKMQTDSYKNKLMTVTGWGSNDEDIESYPDILQKLDVRVTPCKKFWGEAKTLMCAGTSLGQDSCVGDSGGPLMQYVTYKKPHRYFLTGVVSFGYSCSQRRDEVSPGVYARVSHFIPWILRSA